MSKLLYTTDLGGSPNLKEPVNLSRMRDTFCLDLESGIPKVILQLESTKSIPHWLYLKSNMGIELFGNGEYHNLLNTAVTEQIKCQIRYNLRKTKLENLEQLKFIVNSSFKIPSTVT